MPPKILILGGGSIGAITTYLLSHSIPATNITIICRSNYTTLSTHGITLSSTIWGSDLHVKPTVVKSIDEAIHHAADDYDYVCVTVKAVSGTEIWPAEMLKPAISTKTTIVLMQNGIGIESAYKAIFSDNAIASAVLYTPCTQAIPGIYSHALLTQIHIGTYPSTDTPEHKASTAQLVDLLNQGGATATHDEDIQVARWKKLLINGSENPICALTRLRDAEFFRSDPGATTFMRDVMGEIARVAIKLGYEWINEEVVNTQLELLTSREMPGVEPSMMADALAGRSMEVEAVVGNLVRIARREGVDVPRVEALYYLVKGLDCSFRKSGLLQ